MVVVNEIDRFHIASLFISRWDVAVMNKVPETLRDQLGIAIAKRTYKVACVTP